jgi:ribonuclease Z
MQITYFGTGAALNPYVDTMHMLLEDNNNQLYIDAWWGMSLMQKILRKEIKKPEYIRITHCHSDHILWIVHVLRIHKSWKLTIFCSEEIEKKIEQLMAIVGQDKLYKKQINEGLVEYIHINKQKEISLFNWKIKPLNLVSTKAEQYWFTLQQDSKKLIFLWDEAINILEKINYKEMTESDRLLCEAFCLDNEKDERLPHEKNHITAKESWEGKY